MKRLIFVALAFLVGCNGVGSGTNRFVPASPGVPEFAAARAGNPIANARRGRTKVKLTLTVPRRRRGEHAGAKHPSTISAMTQSVSIAVNGGAASAFNATPSSAGCKIGVAGTVCTFALNAPIGTDTFVVSTYSGASGGGTMLDRGSAVVAIVTGKANAPSIVLGPVVTSTADSGIGSLRYAIGSANAGDTIMLMLAPGSKITLTSAPITISNRVSIAGPGVSVSARRGDERHASATYNGVTISGGGAIQIFLVQVGATASISGLILTGGVAAVADQPGGAVSNQGTLALANDVFTGNSSTVQSPLVRRVRSRSTHGRVPRNLHPHSCSTVFVEGGAVYNDGALAVSGTTFDGNELSNNFFGAGNCTFGRGGAIYNDENGTLASSGNTYENNSAYAGGAVFNESRSGQAAFAGDTFAGNTGCTPAAGSGCPSSGCSASSCATYAEGYGGAIYDDIGPGVNISSSTFENNAVGDSSGGLGQGGALYLNTGTSSITGSTFSGNVSGGGTASCSVGYGGAIEDQAAILEIDNDTFSGNQASGDELGQGGAIDTVAVLQGTGDAFTSNAASGPGSACPTTGNAFGGAIDSQSGVTLGSSTFSSDVTTAAGDSDGGAIDNDETASLSGDSFTSNSATVTGAGGAAGIAQGGAVDTGGLVLSGSAFTSNTASAAGTGNEANGGAIDSSGTAGSTGDTFTSNLVAGGSSAGAGGAFYNDGTLASSGDTFKSNSATGLQYADGGAIYDESGLLANGDTFTSNSTTSDQSQGGAIFANEDGSSATNSTFTSNSANALSGQTGLGGAIYDDQGFSLNGSTVSGNTATTSGGGLFLSGLDDSIANSTISLNQVSSASLGQGGGGVNNSNAVTIVNSTISGNAVTVAGTNAGGGGIMNSDTLSMMGSTVSGNRVVGTASGSGSNVDGGGGIFNSSAVTILNSTIDSNSSIAYGGAVENEGGGAQLTNVTLFGNSAVVNGGSIDNEQTLDLANSIVAGGSAPNGPDISNPGTLTSQDYNLIQTTVIGNALGGTTTHNLQTAPLLLALANNGGATLTNAEQASSPTVGHVPFTGGECGGDGNGFDQRGFARGAGGAGGVCDIGAFELGGVPSAGRPARPVAHGHHHHVKKKRQTVRG